MLSSASQSTVTQADAQGVVHYRLVVPPKAKAIADVLTLTGLGEVAADAASAGNVSVSVPRISVLRYQIR